MQIAEHIIEKCGGVNATAAILGVSPQAVYRWTYPKERGGTGGLVPAKYQQTLLASVPGLEPADFFTDSEAA